MRRTGMELGGPVRVDVLDDVRRRAITPPSASRTLYLADTGTPFPFSPPRRATVERGALYVHQAAGRRPREIDAATERFADETRTGAAD